MQKFTYKKFGLYAITWLICSVITSFLVYYFAINFININENRNHINSVDMVKYYNIYIKFIVSNYNFNIIEFTRFLIVNFTVYVISLLFVDIAIKWSLKYDIKRNILKVYNLVFCVPTSCYIIGFGANIGIVLINIHVVTQYNYIHCLIDFIQKSIIHLVPEVLSCIIASYYFFFLPHLTIFINPNTSSYDALTIIDETIVYSKKTLTICFILLIMAAYLEIQGVETLTYLRKY